MSLVLSGELLAVTSEMVNPPAGVTWTAFESRKAMVFDGERVTEVTMAKDCPPQHWNALVGAAKDRPQVAVQVVVGKGDRLYGVRVQAIADKQLHAA